MLLTGFTFTNNRLMLVSRSKQHPNGLGNDRGLVENTTPTSTGTPTTGVFNNRHFKLYAGNTSTQNVIFDFQADIFDHSDLDFIGGGMLFATLGERDPLIGLQCLPLPLAGRSQWG